MKNLTVAAVARMLEIWNTIEAKARVDFPNASEEEIYQITSGAMKHVCKV